MNHLDKIRHSRTSLPATKKKLRLSVTDKKFGAILVVEGQDDSVLITNAFESFFPSITPMTIRCDGKGGVLGLRRYFYTVFPNDTKTMFFIDRDHDDLLKVNNADKRTYITDHYSIEWNMCTPNVMWALVARYYTLSKGDPLWNIVRERFRSMMDDALDHSKLVMQAVVVARRNGESLDLDRIPLSEICRFKAGKLIRTSKGVKALLKQAECKTIPSDDELEEIKSELQGTDVRQYIRGKMILQFYYEFFRKLSQICGYRRKRDDSKFTTSVQVATEKFIQLISPDWKIPDSLDLFFVEWLSRKTK